MKLPDALMLATFAACMHQAAVMGLKLKGVVVP